MYRACFICTNSFLYACLVEIGVFDTFKPELGWESPAAGCLHSRGMLLVHKLLSAFTNLSNPICMCVCVSVCVCVCVVHSITWGSLRLL